MALKALMLRKKIDGAKKNLAALNEKDTELQTREAELEKAIAETETDEERSTVEEAIAKFEADKAENDKAKAEIEETIAGLDTELAEEEAEQEKPAEAKPEEKPAEERNERSEVKTMNKRFFNLASNERDAFFAREDVQNYLSEVRSCIREKRALSNVGLTIPEVFLGLIRENIENYSKLYKHVAVRRLNGDGRVVVQGTIPEAIWTDCCANLNDLDLAFNDEEFYCWKVGGYFAVCNANLEDSDLDLATDLITALGQAIGLALDKAILYGTGNKMPLGVVTRLAQTSQPASYSATARPWVDLHTSNIKPINSSGMTAAQLFEAIVTNSGAAKGKYARGGKVWTMNETTYTALMAKTISVNAQGQVVSGIAGTMPVVGGIIEVLDFIPDNVIIGGYFDLYTLAERAGQKFATSEHVRFLQDQTVMKGTARYDGKPVIAEAFVVMSLNNTAISADAVAFAPDEASTATGIVLNKAEVTVTASTGTTHTAKLIANTLPEGLPVTWTVADSSTATVSSAGVVTGVASGSTTVTAAAGNALAFAAVTVGE